MATTYGERWIQLGINIIAIGLAWRMLKLGNTRKVIIGRENINRMVEWIFLVMNVLAVLLNLFGFANLALLFTYAGGFQIIYALALWVFYRIGGRVSLPLPGSQQRRIQVLLFLVGLSRFAKIGLKRILGFFAVIMWAGAFSKSLGLFELFYGVGLEFFTQPHSIGSATFTYGSFSRLFLGLSISPY